jgi:hypothetical protein
MPASGGEVYFALAMEWRFRPDFVLEWVKADALPGFRRLGEALSK